MKFAKVVTLIALAALMTTSCGYLERSEGRKAETTYASSAAETEGAESEAAEAAGAETAGSESAGPEAAGTGSAGTGSAGAEAAGTEIAAAEAESGSALTGESSAEETAPDQTLPALPTLPPPALTEEIEPETESETETEAVSAHENKLICIDPGHQKHQNSDKEPDGPGSDTMKMKVSSGTSGRYSGLDEYELNLQVSEKLKLELQDRGYLVIMTHDDADVDISNSERAEIANEAGADAFIRIHADGSDSSKDEGAMTICQTKNNPYNADIYKECYALSADIIEEMQAEMDCKSRGVWKTDTMAGINWCQVPVTIVEMGFMSNKKEDLLMASDDYQYKIVRGIANGLDRYFDEMK